MPATTLLQLAAQAALSRSLARSIDEYLQAFVAERGADASVAERIEVDADTFRELMALAGHAAAQMAELEQGLGSSLVPDDLSGSGMTDEDNPD